MGRAISRREAVTGAAAGAVALGAAPASAAAAKESVRGSWRITPKLPPGAPPFIALAAFGSDGVFVTTGSDEPGTGLGQWNSPAADRFAFTYQNFHFDSDQQLHHTTKVRAAGKFAGGSLEGRATLTATGPHGHPLFPPRHFRFTGRRMPVEAP